MCTVRYISQAFIFVFYELKEFWDRSNNLDVQVDELLESACVRLVALTVDAPAVLAVRNQSTTV